jgi:hypothetical protein
MDVRNDPKAPAQIGSPMQKAPMPKVVIIGAVVVIVLLIIITVLVAGSKKNTPSKNPSSSQINNEQSQAIPTAILVKKEPIAIVRDVVDLIKAEKFDAAVPYFVTGENGLSKEQIVKMLRTDKQELTDPTKGYEPQLSPYRVMTSGEKAQVLVQYLVKGTLLTARYDMQGQNGVWRIGTIRYNEGLDLLTTAKKEQEAQQVMQKARYSEAKTSFALPNGDTVVLDKTLLSGLDHDIFVHTENFKQGYTLVIYDAPHIRTIEYILPGETAENAVHAFDYRDIEDKGGGLLMFYPENTPVSLGDDGNPPGVLLQIPIKIK